MLDILIAAYPGEVTKENLATEAEVNRGSGTFSDYVSSLRNVGLLEDVDQRTVRAGSSLFPRRARR